MNRIAAQRRQAAALGTEVRSRRAEVKRRISTGNLSLPELLRADGSTFAAIGGMLDGSPVAAEIPIGQLVRSVRGIGPATAAGIFDDLQLNPDRPLGEYSDAQRRELADELERT